MTELPIQRLLLEAVDVVEGLKFPYMIMGGFAVRTWGVPRPTYDADLAVEAADDELPRLTEGFGRAGFDVPQEHQKGFTDVVSGMKKFKVTRFEGRTVWEVDVFLVRTPLLESALARRRTASFAGRQVSVMAPEDLILLKLIAFRRKDQFDVEEILKIARDLDHGYLKAWAKKLDLVERLESFLGPR